MPTYLISKMADPIFAFAIGSSAALLRIRRTEQEKYPDRAAQIGFGSIFEMGTNRVQRWWKGDFESL